MVPVAFGLDGMSVTGDPKDPPAFTAWLDKIGKPIRHSRSGEHRGWRLSKGFTIRDQLNRHVPPQRVRIDFQPQSAEHLSLLRALLPWLRMPMLSSVDIHVDYAIHMRKVGVVPRLRQIGCRRFPNHRGQLRVQKAWQRARGGVRDLRSEGERMLTPSFYFGAQKGGRQVRIYDKRVQQTKEVDFQTPLTRVEVTLRHPSLPIVLGGVQARTKKGNKRTRTMRLDELHLIERSFEHLDVFLMTSDGLSAKQVAQVAYAAIVGLPGLRSHIGPRAFDAFLIKFKHPDRPQLEHPAAVFRREWPGVCAQFYAAIGLVKSDQAAPGLPSRVAGAPSPSPERPTKRPARVDDHARDALARASVPQPMPSRRPQARGAQVRSCSTPTDRGLVQTRSVGIAQHRCAQRLRPPERGCRGSGPWATYARSGVA